MLEVLVIRHGIAETPEEAAARGREADAMRELTRRGRKRLRAAAPALADALPDLDLIGASPLIRAQQTAELLADAWSAARIETVAALAPGKESGLFAWLAERREACLALVGHQPGLGSWVAEALSGAAGEWLDFGKGMAVLLRFPGAPAPAAARLRWALRNAQLRALDD